MLVLATDGVWDVVTNDAVGPLATAPGPIGTTCNALVDHALALSSRDNITAILARLL